MNENLTAREFDQFRIDDREWKQQMDERMDTLLTTLSAQDKRLATVESHNSKSTTTANKMSAGVAVIISAIVNGIIASFSTGGK